MPLRAFLKLGHGMSLPLQRRVFCGLNLCTSMDLAYVELYDASQRRV